MESKLDFFRQSLDAELAGKFYKMRPGCFIYFHAFFKLSRLYLSPAFARQKNLFKTRRWPSGLYEQNQFIDFREKTIQRLEFFHSNGLQKYAIICMAAFVPPL